MDTIQQTLAWQEVYDSLVRSGVERGVARNCCHYSSHGLRGDGRSRQENTTCTNFHQSPPPTVRATAVPALLSPRHQWVVPRDDVHAFPFANITQLEYYCHLLLTEVWFGLLGRRLLNEYLVDVFSSVEDSRLNYVRQHVQTRIASSRELDETINAEGGARAGRVYLLLSFMGSPKMQPEQMAWSW